MKKVSLFIVSSVFIVLYFMSSTSCNREDYSKEIAKLDSLKSHLTVYKVRLDSIDSTYVMNLKPIIDRDIEWIKDSLTKETMSLGAVFLVTVRAGSKLTDSFPTEYTSLKNEVNYSITQLEDLLKDLNKGSIEAIKARKYLNDEEMAYKVIERHVNKMTGRLESLKDYPDIRKEFYDKIRQQGLSSE